MSLWLWLTFCRRSPRLDDTGVHDDSTAGGNELVATYMPETGRGQASLWTAAAAPDHRLWTTLRGPVDPSRLPTCPLPLRRGRPPTTHQSHQSKERRLTPSAKSPNRHWRTSTGPNRWAIPEHRSGPYRLVKSSCVPDRAGP